jgi:hypothetical protein
MEPLKTWQEKMHHFYVLHALSSSHYKLIGEGKALLLCKSNTSNLIRSSDPLGRVLKETE